MTVSSVYNYRLLNAWARWNQVSPWAFNQIVGAGVDAPLSEPGKGIFVRPEIELITQGIRSAQALALGHLGTFHRPEYVTEHILLNPFKNLSSQFTRLRYHHVQAIGSRGVTLIDADAAVTYSDSDGDGIDDLATVTVSTAVTDVTEVQVFFRTADGAAGAADRRWQIEPLKVEISGGTATISGHRSLFVKPSLWAVPYNSPNYNSSSKHYGSTTNAGDFVTAVDVYRIYPDTTSAVRLIRPTPCEPCADTVDSGCAVITDGRLGLFRLALNPAVCLSGAYTAVEIDYLAGYPLDPFTGEPDSTLERALTRLANAEIPRVPPNLADTSICIWSYDASVYPVKEALDDFTTNPFGARIGQIEAWRMMRLPEYSVGYGGAMGW